MHSATNWVFPRMDEHLCLQVISCFAGVATLCAPERFFCLNVSASDSCDDQVVWKRLKGFLPERVNMGCLS